MATLVLTAAGTAVAGPLGGAIGAVLGQAADQMLFAPKARHGPRLGDLAVQTSSYGTQIPKLFGTIRVAGTVVWATDIVESRSSSGGGKGRPRTVGYSYSANFAVALSGRKVRAVHRIWAEGKLLRGGAGDLKTGGEMRFHDGGEDQPADPLIASAEGPAGTPAFRGTAYVVFEQLELADFGNRIPSLTFEVEADPGPVAVGRIAEELSQGVVAEGFTPSVRGYAATGDSVRSALSALADPLLLSLSDTGDRLVLGLAAGDAAIVASDELAGGAERIRQSSGTVPGEVTFSYYDPERDYQTGTQRAFRGEAAAKTESVSLPVVLAAGEAKALAEARLASLSAARTTAKVRLGWRREALRPGRLVRLPEDSALWKVRRWLLEGTAIALELLRLGETPAVTASATAGRAIGDADRVAGPTVLRLLDLPLASGTEGAFVAALACGTQPGWRGAAILCSADGGTSWQELGRTAEPAILGQAESLLAPAGSALLDLVSSVDIELLRDLDVLESRSDAALVEGANAAMVGSEIIQFGSALPLGERRFRLSRLLRGRRGTEWAAGGHAEREPFALLSAETMLQLPAAAAGSRMIAIAVGVGDSQEGVRAEIEVSAEALRPPSPVHLRAGRAENGDLVVEWVRRSRLGWSWPSGADTPLGEEKEAYVASVTGGGGGRTFESEVPRLVYPAAQQAADGISYPVLIDVAQIGTHATSRPATLSFG